MSDKTGIQWTDKTWNPWRGCGKVSPGCAHCYMFSEQTRYGKDPEVVVRTKTWGDPARWERRAYAIGVTWRVFTCSWSDWFHETADPWRDEAWAIVKRCPHLIFQILTKRHDRIFTHLPADWGAGYQNVWLGVSVENQHWADVRIPALLQTPAAVRFVSYEPALGPIDLRIYLQQFMEDGFIPALADKPYDLTTLSKRLDWVIVGGESGPKARPFNLEWARSTLMQCKLSGVPCFIKQLGKLPYEGESPFASGPEAAGCRLFELDLDRGHGGDWTEWPADLRVRQFPAINRLMESA